MADVQSITQSITQVAIEVTKAAVQAMAVAEAEESTRQRSTEISFGPKLGGPSLKQPSLDWRV